MTVDLGRSGGRQQRLTLEAPSSIGLPTAFDEDVLLACQAHSKQYDNFESDVVWFRPHEIREIMRIAKSGHFNERLFRSFQRLTALTATYEFLWYRKQTRDVDPRLVTGVFAEAEVVFRRNAHTGPADSRFQWTKSLHDTLKEGSVLDIDLDLYFSLERIGSRQLFRHLNKRWHSGRRPQRYSRDLKEIACGHLGMTDCKDLKRNFHRIVTELESRDYLEPLSVADRYQKIGPGIWRVHFDLASNRGQVRPHKAETSTSSADRARELVACFHEHRFRQTEYSPLPPEVEYAAELLEEHDFALLQVAVRKCASIVAERFPKGQIFGCCKRYLPEVIRDLQRDRTRRKAEADQLKATLAAEEQLARVRVQKAERKAILMEHWLGIEESKRQVLLDEAVADEPSPSMQAIMRKAGLHQPHNAVLDRLALSSNLTPICAGNDSAIHSESCGR